MSTLGRKRREDVWTYFMFNVKENKTLYKPCGVTLIGRNAEKNVHVIFYSTESLVCYNLMIFSQLKLKA